MNESAEAIPIRERLLAALDAEIDGKEKTRAASGRTRWAIILGLSGLLWLGLQLRDEKSISWKNVALLSVAITVIFEQILNVAGALDASILPQQSGRGKFISFSKILGALRSTVLFFAFKSALLLHAAHWSGFPNLLPVKVYLAGSALAGFGGFLFSYIDSPPLSYPEMTNRSWLTRAWHRAIDRGTWVLRLSAAFAVGFAAFRTIANFSSIDFRLSILIAAFVYLLGLLVVDKFPLSQLAALRSVRQDLGFERISEVEARGQIDDLLFVGKGVVETMQPVPEALLALAGQIRSTYSQIENLLPGHKKLGLELAQLQLPLESAQMKRDEFDRMHNFLSQTFRQANAQHDALLKRVGRFHGQIKLIGFFSAASAKSLEPFLEQIRYVLEPLNEQRNRLKASLSLNPV